MDCTQRLRFPFRQFDEVVTPLLVLKARVEVIQADCFESLLASKLIPRFRLQAHGVVEC